MGVEIAMLVLRRISSSAVAALSMVVDLAFRKQSARLSPEAHRLLGKIACTRGAQFQNSPYPFHFRGTISCSC